MENVVLFERLQEKDKPHTVTALVIKTPKPGAVLRATHSQRQTHAFSLGTVFICRRRRLLQYHLPFFSGTLSSSVSLSGLMQPPCMVRSCHPIILRCIQMICRNLGKSRSLQDMAFTFISHIWILSHRTTASTTLWRYCPYSHQVRKRQEGEV